MPCLPVVSAISCSAQSAKPDEPGALVDEDQLVAQRRWCRPSRRRAAAPGLASSSSASRSETASASSSSAADVGAGQPARHQAERGQRGVAAADVGVGVDDAVAGLARTAWSSGEPGSVTTTIRVAGSMPASVNACSKARRWQSVSTVQPDLLDTTTTVRSSRSAERPRGPGRGRWSRGRSARRRTSRRSPRAPATSRPCRRARRGRRPASASSLRSAAISPTSGRDAAGQGRPRTAASRTPPRPPGPTASRPARRACPAKPSVDQRRHVRADRVGGGAGGDDLEGLAHCSRPAPVELAA